MIWSSFPDEENKCYFYVLKTFINDVQYICRIQKIVMFEDYCLEIYHFDKQGNYKVAFTKTLKKTKALMKEAQEFIEKL